MKGFHDIESKDGKKFVIDKIRRDYINMLHVADNTCLFAKIMFDDFRSKSTTIQTLKIYEYTVELAIRDVARKIADNVDQEILRRIREGSVR